MNENFYERNPGRGAGDDCGCRKVDDRGCRNIDDRGGRTGDDWEYKKGSSGSRAEMMRKIQQYNFMMIEAGLFLNNQPCCEAAQEAFCKYQKLYVEAVAEYEKCYGPLTFAGINSKRDGWSWINGPWPWEGEDC